MAADDLPEGREIDRRAPTQEDMGIPGPAFEQTIGLVRALLEGGLPRETTTGCVRLNKFEPYGGGMKSSLVGGLSVHLGLTLKVGGAELDGFLPMFHEANRLGLARKGLEQAVFPTCHRVDPLQDDAGQRVAIMDHLRSYESLFDTVARRAADTKALSRAVHRATQLLDVVHDLPKTVAAGRTSRPKELYFDRLRAKLDELSATRGWIGRARTRGIVLVASPGGGGDDGDRLPALDGLLDEMEARLPAPADGAAVVLHGDPHLGNLMLRKNGRGFRVRLIDPNPAWGVGDYLYDVGKAFHYAGDVGLVRDDPDRAAGVEVDDRGPHPIVRVPGQMPGVPEAVRERQRIVREALVAWRDRKAAALREEPDGPRFHLAVATATLATASMLRDDRSVAFIVYHAFLHLAEAAKALARGRQG